MRCVYRERKILCGDYLEVQIFPVFKSQKGRSAKAKPTSEVQEKLNAKNAEFQITRTMHANFTRADVEAHLTYNDDTLPDSPEQAQRDAWNFLRRVKRYRAKHGLPPLKYISVTEIGNGGRIHHHITMNGGIDRDVLEELWGKGYANTKRLQFNRSGITGLAKYITKSPLFYKRWNASRNLRKPKITERDGRISQRRVKELANFDSENSQAFEKLYPQFDFTASEPLFDFVASFPLFNEINDGHYIRAYFCRKQ